MSNLPVTTTFKRVQRNLAPVVKSVSTISKIYKNLPKKLENRR